MSVKSRLSAIALRLLGWLILAYRRWLSGRGPFRGVQCTFRATESCSAFGLRATREATTAGRAIARIVRRLRRCGDACLVTDGAALSWSPLHERSPTTIADAMRRDGEREAAIARVLDS